MTTRVMFLKYTEGEFKDDITALFIDNNFTYDHIGQHSEADFDYILKQNNTALAGIREFFDLYTELKQIGYDDLEIVYQF